jgi:hypothetical protein
MCISPESRLKGGCRLKARPTIPPVAPPDHQNATFCALAGYIPKQDKTTWLAFIGAVAAVSTLWRAIWIYEHAGQVIGLIRP